MIILMNLLKLCTVLLSTNNLMIRNFLSDADRQHLQDYLNKLTEWSEKWQMFFSSNHKVIRYLKY